MRISLFTILIIPALVSIYSQTFWTPTGNITSAGDDWVPEIACNSTGTLLAYSFNNGIFRSTNNGDEWSLSGITNLKVSNISTSPDGKIFAICNNTSGIYLQLSTDDGLSWNQVYSAVHNNNFFSGSGMVFMDSNVVVAAISFTLGPTLGDIGVEIVKSTDGGLSWQLLFIANGFGGAESLIRQGNRIFITTTLSGIWYSDDNGSNWNHVASSPSSFISCIQINSSGDIFIGRNTAAGSVDLVFRSSDNGNSWQNLGILSGQSGGNIRAMYIDNQDRIYVAFNLGANVKLIYRSTDNGNSWLEFTEGIPSSQLVYSLTGNPEDIVFAGTQSSGVYKGFEVVPVELTSFIATAQGNNVELKWETASETNSSGFDVERCTESLKWDKIGFVNGHGTTTEPQFYFFNDESLQSGKYQYRLKQVDYDGSFNYSETLVVNIGIADKFVLEQNYPNPFNPTTKIRFQIADRSFVSLKVFDVLGNEVITPVNEEKPEGKYEISFNGSNLPSGVYFYKLTAGKFSETKKLIMLK
jgi:photosystem II stability/assembly factor-like uncharacterized protein